MDGNSTCALCLVELTDENKTKEHIIPNAIGGWEKVEGFICVSCNNGKGNTWDAELASQFNWFSVMTGIVRERNEPPPELVKTISGERFLLQNDGTMLPASFKYKEVKDGERTKISFAARTPKEAAKKIEEIAKRFPQFDKETALANAQEVQTSYLDEPIHVQFSFGGPLAGRSVVNSGLAFAFSKGINPHSCESVLGYLRNQNSPPSCYGLFYLKDIVKNRPANTIFHCVAICGDTSKRRLLAYVEYFGAARWLIALSNNYDGPNVNYQHAIDPTNAKPVDIRLQWEITDEMIERTVSGNGYTTDDYSSEFGKTIEIILRLSNERDQRHAIERAFWAARKKLGMKVGDQITPDIAQAFALTMTNELNPFIRHLVGGKKGKRN